MPQPDASLLLPPALDVVWPAGLDLAGVPCLWEAPARPAEVARPVERPVGASERALVERLQLALGLLALGHLVAPLDGLTLGGGLLVCGVLSLLLTASRFVRDQRAIGRLWRRETLAGASTALLLAAAGSLLTLRHLVGG